MLGARVKGPGREGNDAMGRSGKQIKEMRGIGKTWVWTMTALNRLPLIQRWHPWFKPEKTDMRWLPINQDIKLPGSAPMPLELLYGLIEEASHRAIYEYCGCRKGFHCEHYPVEIGCLLLGDSAIEGKRFPWREVCVEEAKEHVRRAAEAGLVPVVGKARADNFIFGIKDRARLLTVCLCCECCCITRLSALAPLEYVEPLFPRLEGILITVTDRCKGCGKCVEHCYTQAIEILDGRAFMSGYCRACGRCAMFCPNKAIEVEITDEEFLDKTRERIRSYVKHD